MGFPGGSVVKKKKKINQFRRIKRCSFNPGIRKIPWSRKGQATPEFLPGESRGRRSLVGYSPQGCRALSRALRHD